ncbi:MAG TPA: LCP family protein [Actinophytocola sp.]|jgi:LCP family protein required for cell wall assembly|nr:LCP family protein [Actinophytocola sp.]
MSYGHQQGAPRRPGHGGAPGYGRPQAPGRRPEYHETRALPVPPNEAPRYRRPPGRFDGPPPPDGYGPPQGDGYPPPPRRRKRRRPGRTIGIIVLILLVILGGTYFWLDTSLTRVEALTDYPGRPAEAAGTNWLIVGSDSREGLTPEQKKKLATGDAAGQRTDTMLIAHLPDNDTAATLLSLPRDSNVEIPGHGVSKINAAFALGGPKLLVQTVEKATGLRMDHYAEINFGGFANMVDAVGGVEMDIPTKMHDTVTGATIKAGHQTLDGAQALAFVRMRHSAATPRSDLDRIANQRKFIGALASEIASPGTFLNPFALFPLLSEVPDALTVDEGDHLFNLAGLGFAMGGISDGDTITTTVPVTDGSATQWDDTKSEQLFDALKTDAQIPKDAISK